MQYRSGEADLHFVEHGGGAALHGAGVDHREIEAAIEAAVPSRRLRRIYPDLPGMGRSTADGLTCNADVVRLLVDFIDHLGVGPVLLLGHSYGAYLARGVAARRPDIVHGLALLCPVGEESSQVPERMVVRQDVDAYDELDPEHRAGFDEYFVVRTAETARRYREYVVPGTQIADEVALGRIFTGWTLDLDPVTCTAPTLIVAGRNDSAVGYANASRLLECYPNATFAVLYGAGHALVHERPQLVAALLADWLERCDSHQA